MGIRFHCPNGHKLNVKSELAGRRAICPECGVKLLVPQLVGQTPNPAAMSSAIDLPVALPSGIGLTSAPAASVAPPAASLTGAVWYVRPKGGGQYGPATDEVFRAWVAEGRVGADAHVWREGWPDWKLASDAAVALPGTAAAAATIDGPAATPPAAEKPPTSQPVDLPNLTPESHDLPSVGDEAARPASRYLASRQRANKRQVTLAVVMLAAIIALACVLVWVLRRSAAPAETASQRSRTPLAEPAAAAYVAGVDVHSRLHESKSSGSYA